MFPDGPLEIKIATMDPPDSEPQLRPLQERRMKKELTRDTRQRIVSRLLSELKDHGEEGRFARRTIPFVAQDFHVCKRTIRRVWACALENFENPDIRQFRSSPQNQFWETQEVEP